MEDIEHYDIPVYNFPYDVEEDDEETIQDNSELRVGHIFILRHWTLNICYLRLFCHLLLSDQRRKLRSMDSSSGLAFTHGVLRKLTTQNTLISAG